MKAVRKHTGNGTMFRLEEIESPVLSNPDDVLIRVGSIGICTSDLHAWHGTMSMPDGNIVGHEFSGTVVALGPESAKQFSPGDRVVCELAKGACMACRECRSGHYELCSRKQPPGWKSQGVYAEYTVQPAFCVHKIPPDLSLDVAAMAEPVAICVYGCLERGEVNKEDFTVVYGMGSIGLFTLITLLDHGVKNIVCVTPTGRGTERLELASEIGAAASLPFNQEVDEKIRRMNDGRGADCVIDCSGAPDAINQGLGLLAKGGKFIALGISRDDPIPFRFNTGVLSVLKMVFSATSSHGSWITAIGILERNRAGIEKVITHRFQLEEWEKAYRMLESRKAIKAVLHPV
jgi:L-iditol 2-dehydrogenase